tara:strand:+ start:639 stop:917 length:279 start_codon:yes stop_codon:yes gene_type:complete
MELADLALRTQADEAISVFEAVSCAVGDHSIKELEAVRGQYVFELPDPDKPVPSAETMQRAKELSKEIAAGKVQVKSVEKLTAFDLHKKGIG